MAERVTLLTRGGPKEERSWHLFGKSARP